jgi:transcription elongation GreA/GreB family factor
VYAVGEESKPTVQQGSRVRIQDGDGQERVILIRGEGAESWAADSITTDTPLARAILGHRAGDEVTVEPHPSVPVRKVTILAIE